MLYGTFSALRVLAVGGSEQETGRAFQNKAVTVQACLWEDSVRCCSNSAELCGLA